MRPAISLLLLWVTLASAGGNKPPPIEVFPTNTYGHGLTTFSEQPIEVGISEVSLVFDRADWTQGNQALEYGMSVSYDAGVTWSALVSAATGHSNESITSVTGFPGQLSNPDRRTRGFIIVKGAPLHTRGYLRQE